MKITNDGAKRFQKYTIYNPYGIYASEYGQIVEYNTLAKKWEAPFSVMVTSDTFDFSDPSILRVPAFML